MKVLLLLMLLSTSCRRIIGPTYSYGSSHNSTMAGRNSVVNREDSRMKKTMARERVKAMKSLPKRKKIRKKRGRKFVN